MPCCRSFHFSTVADFKFVSFCSGTFNSSSSAVICCSIAAFALPVALVALLLRSLIYALISCMSFSTKVRSYLMGIDSVIWSCCIVCSIIICIMSMHFSIIAWCCIISLPAIVFVAAHCHTSRAGRCPSSGRPCYASSSCFPAWSACAPASASGVPSGQLSPSVIPSAAAFLSCSPSTGTLVYPCPCSSPAWRARAFPAPIR